MTKITSAPEYDSIVSATDIRRQANGTPVLTSEEVNLLRELQQLFDRIDHDKYSNPCIWITIPRGPIERWETWEEAQEYEEVKTKAEYEELWKMYYPDELCWYQAAFSTTEEGYMAFLVSGGKHETAFLKFDPRCDKIYAGVDSYYADFLRYSADRVREATRMLGEETYNSYVEKNLPWKYRTGTIPREVLWKLAPEIREYDLDDLTEEDISVFEENVAKMPEQDKAAIQHFTSGEYFRLCRLGYQEAYQKRYDASLNDVDLYRRLSDGRDNGLSKIRTDSEDELRRWFSGELQEFNGSHPWEVIPGGNATHVSFDMYLDKDGFHLSVDGKYRTYETVRFFNALCRDGKYPVYLYHAESILNRLKGKGLYGVVPTDVPLTYVQQYFPEGEVIDAIHLYNLDEYDIGSAGVLPYISWHREPAVQLTGTAKNR